jgi:D-alanine-D-alanine ligase
MNKLHVAVLMGGPSTESKVSKKTGAAAVRALHAAGMRVTPVDVPGADFELPAGTDVAFLALHGTFGEDGQIQRILDLRGVPYTGSDAESSERAFDKAAAKAAFAAAGVPTPQHIVVERDVRQVATMKPPVVVKPARQGSSYGVSIVRDAAKLEWAIEQAWRYDQKLVVEQFVKGREFTVGILDGNVLPVVEILIPPGQDGFSTNAKYNGKTPEIVPAEIDPLTTRRMQDAALRAHVSLGCRDYSRVDVMLGENGELFVLEVNTLPGLTEQSLLPKAARAVEINMEALCARLVEMALERRAEAVAA